MVLNERVVTTLFADTVAILLLGGLMILARSRWREKDMASRLFFRLFVFTLLHALANGASYALRYRTFASARSLALLACTLSEGAVLVLLFVWLEYVDYSLYHSQDHLRRTYLRWSMPIVVFIALLVINIPTGIVFYINSDVVYTPRILYRVIEYTEYAYLIASLVLLLRYYRTHGSPRFFMGSSFLVPLIVSSLITDVTYYSVRALGIAIGLVTLFFSTENYRRFLDGETGYYNEGYLQWLFECGDTKERYVSAVAITAEAASEKSLVAVLKKESPEGAEMIHLAKGQFLLLSDVPGKSFLRMLSDMITEASGEAGLSVRTREYVRKKDELPMDFAERLIAEAYGQEAAV